jgi:hypothetical protein
MAHPLPWNSLQEIGQLEGGSTNERIELSNKITPLDDLKKYLQGVQPGTIDNATDLEMLLAWGWHELKGDDGGMVGHKLIGRMEDVTWDPPIIYFTIERHGATALRSTRA